MLWFGWTTPPTANPAASGLLPATWPRSPQPRTRSSASPAPPSVRRARLAPARNASTIGAANAGVTTRARETRPARHGPGSRDRGAPEHPELGAGSPGRATHRRAPRKARRRASGQAAPRPADSRSRHGQSRSSRGRARWRHRDRQQDHRGEVRVERVGGLFTDRHSILKIGGRDQTKLIDGVERQVKIVAGALTRAGFADLDIRGALCFPDPDGLPLRQLSARGIVIDGPKPIAELARRAGTLSADEVDQLARRLAAPSRPPDRRRCRRVGPLAGVGCPTPVTWPGATTTVAVFTAARPDLPPCMERSSGPVGRRSTCSHEHRAAATREQCGTAAGLAVPRLESRLRCRSPANNATTQPFENPASGRRDSQLGWTAARPTARHNSIRHGLFGR